MVVFAVVTCGIIRDRPGMLRLVRLYCVCLQISVWGGKKLREDGYYVGRRKMLCWATKQKVSNSLFPPPIQSQHNQQGCRCHSSGASWQSRGGVDLQWTGKWHVGRGHYELCVGRGGYALLSHIFSSKPGPGFSLETCTVHSKYEGGGCATFTDNFPQNQMVWMLKPGVMNMTGGRWGSTEWKFPIESPAATKCLKWFRQKACLFGEKQGLRDCRDGGAQNELRA